MLGSGRPRSHLLVLIVLPTLVATACAGSTHHHARLAFKANGCTATVSGHSAGRPVITYSDETHDSQVQAALQQAVTRWNSSGVHLVLQSVASGGTIGFVPTTGPTHTASCTTKGTRNVVVYLKTTTFASGGTPQGQLPNLLAREIGHALGLAKAGPCGALMTIACKSIPPGPDPAEVAEINRLYASA